MSNPREAGLWARWKWLVATALLVQVGWGCDAEDGSEVAAGSIPNAARGDAADSGVERPALCDRPGADRVRDVFCAPRVPSIRSLRDLQRSLGLDVGDGYASIPNDNDTTGGFKTFGGPQIAILNTSTALSGVHVSTLNPRVIIVGDELVFAFNRGVQQVELIAGDRDSGRLTFYLVRFGQACNSAAEGCSKGALFTSHIEDGWTRVALQDDEELKNTASDCRQCHARGIESPILLMRELTGPWTHFFAAYQDTPNDIPEPSGIELARTYYALKGAESYAGIEWSALSATTAQSLENAVPRPQPLTFNSVTVLNERWPWNDGYPAQALRSSTWQTQYEAFKRGEQLALPYFAPMREDSEKLRAFGAAYRAYQEGALALGDLPDPDALYSDDAMVRAEMGFGTEPSATPAQALVQACGQCHNDVLDQTISRARFNVDVARLGRDELVLAADRLRRPIGMAGHMPPEGFRQVAQERLEQLAAFLEAPQLSDTDRVLLQRAAELGMAQP